MINLLKINTNKILTGTGFYLCLAFTILLCFSATIYTDPVRNDHYSVFMALQEFDRDFMLSDPSFCAIQVIRRAADGWLNLFLPILSAFGFVPLVCDGFQAGSDRFEIFRTGKRAWSLSQFLSACLCGGVVTMAGCAVFSVLVLLLFPGINDYPMDQQEFLWEMLTLGSDGRRTALLILRMLGSSFLYGAVWAVPAITLTAFIRNKYLVLCIPFFLKYAAGQTCRKIQTQAVTGWADTDGRLLRIFGIANPDSLAHLPELGSDTLPSLLYNGLFVIAAFVIYFLANNAMGKSSVFPHGRYRRTNAFVQIANPPHISDSSRKEDGQR